jgi:hypothetical protein
LGSVWGVSWEGVLWSFRFMVYTGGGGAVGGGGEGGLAARGATVAAVFRG